MKTLLVAAILSSGDATLRITVQVTSAERYTMTETPLAPDVSRVTVAAVTCGGPGALHTTDTYLVIDGSRERDAVAFSLVGDELTYSHGDEAIVMRWPDKMSVGEAVAVGRFLLSVGGEAYAGRSP